MDIIEQAREIGKSIQQDDRYLKMRVAIQNADEDKDLQNLIGQYNLKRIAIQNEMQKDDRSDEKLKVLQGEMNAVYDAIMKNPNMDAYNSARDEFAKLIRRVNAIIEQSANGADPETADYEESACTGNCSSCGGCH